MWVQNGLWMLHKALMGPSGTCKGSIRLPEAILYLDSPPHPFPHGYHKSYPAMVLLASLLESPWANEVQCPG